MGPGRSGEEESRRMRASDRAGWGTSECGRRRCVEGRSRAAGVRGTRLPSGLRGAGRRAGKKKGRGSGPAASWPRPRPSKREIGGKSDWAAKQRAKLGRGREKRAGPNLELG